MSRKRTLNIDRGALKALVTLFGPREAARQAGLVEGTVLKMAFKFGWKKAVVSPDTQPKDAGDMIANAVARSKQLSTANLARFVEHASSHAAETPVPLAIAGDVKDVAAVYRTLWPQEKQSGMIEGAILIGTAKVTDVLPSEKPVDGVEVIDAGNDTLPQELPDSGPAGD